MSNYHDVLVRDIIIGDRFRKDFGDITALKTSIEKWGVLEPILLDRDNNLLAGGRRLRAVTELKLPRVPAIYLDEIDSLKAREIELEENIQRKDLEWQERAALIDEINRLRLDQYAGQTKPPDSTIDEIDRQRDSREVPAWTQRDTAHLVGLSDTTVSQSLRLVRAMEVMPELADEPSLSLAIRKVDRRLEELEREWNFRQLKKTGKLTDDSSGQVLLGEALEHLATLADASVDCVIIDPPYGVLELGGMGRGASNPDVHFDDDPDKAMAHLRLVANELKRITKPEAHIYVFFGIKLWVEVIEIFTSLGFPVDTIPCVWSKSTGSPVDWDYRFANTWEPILFISSRQRRLNFKRSNVFVYDSVPVRDRLNHVEKPIDLIKELLLLSTRPGDLVLDCYAGSGVVADAALYLNRRFIVIEKNQDQFNAINLRLDETRKVLNNGTSSETQVDDSEVETNLS